MKKFLFLLLSLCSTTSFAYEPVDTADRELDLNEVVVTKKVDGRRRSMVDPVNTEIITGTELFRARAAISGKVSQPILLLMSVIMMPLPVPAR